MDASIARLRRTTMRISPMGRILLWILPAVVLATAPAAAQQNAPDTRGRVYTLLGGAFGDGPFIATGAGAGIRLTPRLGLDLELVHLSGTGEADRAGGVSAYPVGSRRAPSRCSASLRQRLTTFLTRIVVDLAGGGGVTRDRELRRRRWSHSAVPAASSTSPRRGDGRNHRNGLRLRFVPGLEPRSSRLALSLGGGVDVRLWRGLLSASTAAGCASVLNYRYGAGRRERQLPVLTERRWRATFSAASTVRVLHAEATRLLRIASLRDLYPRLAAIVVHRQAT